ncbi:hypothetical protein [Corynebacterium casei]|uniref:hypothetical protein n=1 Tax=Corynebacterium casei TaxID=160386 RepID=UPI001866A5BF|nr:hypothetical protein [Corynebacterium casei]
MTSSFSIACASLASSLHNIDRELERDKVKSDGVVFLPFVETSSVMASGTSTGLVL